MPLMGQRKRAYIPKTRGCFECSQRRIDCDRNVPNCSKCVAKGIACSGLGVRYRFGDDVQRAKSYKYRSEYLKQHVDTKQVPSGETHIDTSSTHANGSTISFPIPDVVDTSDSSLISLPRSVEDSLEPWKLHFLDYFSKWIAPELVVIDDFRNGWRRFTLPIAHDNELLRQTVLSASAFHFSSRTASHALDARHVYHRALAELRKRQNIASLGVEQQQVVLLALLILLATMMVNGSSDFIATFNLLESALSAVGGEDAVSAGDLGQFVTRQISKYRGYVSPFLSQSNGCQRLGLNISSVMANVDGWDCFNSYFCAYPDLREQFSTVYDLNKQACHMYVSRALGGAQMAAQTTEIDRFIHDLKRLPERSPGYHTLVWATFIAAAESVVPEQQDYLAEALMGHWHRNGFANILEALKYLRQTWVSREVRDWTANLPDLKVFIV